ncbi:hypothetical protein EJB05_26327, partial [Eragrostis curvula]
MGAGIDSLRRQRARFTNSRCGAGWQGGGIASMAGCIHRRMLSSLDAITPRLTQSGITTCGGSIAARACQMGR